MTFAFILTMPGRNSWNGKWSGDENVYAVIRSTRSQKSAANYAKLIGRHYYRWSDGWCACVECKEVDRAQAAKLRKASRGFHGYEWMIDSLERYGKIYASHEEPTEAVV